MFGSRRPKKPRAFSDADLRLMSVRLLSVARARNGTSTEQMLLLLGPKMRLGILIELERDELLTRNKQGRWLITPKGYAAACAGRA